MAKEITRRSARLYQGAIGVLLVLLIVTGLYGAGGPFVWGHYGYHAGEYTTRARNTIRHHDLLPSHSPGYLKPDNASYYLHHPVLTHQLVTATLLVLGQREVAVRAAALLSTVASFLLLVALLRRLYGPWQAVLGGALFVLVPIHIWFAAHIDPGLPGIACVLGLFLGYFAWLDSGRWQTGLLALSMFTLAGLFEWSPYLAAIPLGLHVLYVGIQRRGRYLAWAGLFVVAGLLPLLLHAGIVLSLNHLPEMRESYTMRTGSVKLLQMLTRLKDPGREMFGTPLLIAVAGALGVILLRALRARSLRRDLVMVSFAFSLGMYCVLFPNAVFVHIHRLLYGGVLCALAGVELAVTAQALVQALTARWPVPGSRAAQAVAAAAALLLVGATIPLSWKALITSRRLGGVPLERYYDPGLSARAFGQRVVSLTSSSDTVYVHPGFPIRKDLYFDFDRNLTPLPNLASLMLRPAAERAHAVILLREPLPPWESKTLLSELLPHHAVWRVHEYLLVDLRTNTPAEHRERMAPPTPRSFLRRYWEGPYQHPVLVPQ